MVQDCSIYSVGGLFSEAVLFENDFNQYLTCLGIGRKIFISKTINYTNKYQSVNNHQEFPFPSTVDCIIG